MIAEGEDEINKAASPKEEEDENPNVAEKKKKLEERKKRKKKRLIEEAAKADKRGICYLSRIPPHMDHVKLRKILSPYGDIQRIYLTPENPTVPVYRIKEGGSQGMMFSEGWVEFTKKSVAKRVANMLNGEQIGGKKRSAFHYDIWNIKYLSKFKWDDLTEENAYKNAVREQKLALEISTAKRGRDFYLSKVDQSRSLESIEKRIKKEKYDELSRRSSSASDDAGGSEPSVDNMKTWLEVTGGPKGGRVVGIGFLSKTYKIAGSSSTPPTVMAEINQLNQEVSHLKELLLQRDQKLKEFQAKHTQEMNEFHTQQMLIMQHLQLASTTSQIPPSISPLDNARDGDEGDDFFDDDDDGGGRA